MDDGIPEGLEEPRDGHGTLRGEWPHLALASCSWGFGLWLWLRLPPIVPTHWNGHLQPDAWGPKAEAAFLLPALATGLYLLMTLLPRTGWGVVGARAMTSQIRLITLGFLVAIHVILYAPLALNPGNRLPGGTVIWVAVALLLILLGNLMPRLEVRSRQREAWRRAMRIGGRVVVVAGLLQLAFFWIPLLPHLILILVTTLAASLTPYVIAQRRIIHAPEPAQEPVPRLLPHDALALLGAALAATALAFQGAHPLPARYAFGLLAALPLAWGLLFAEARLRRAGEVRRARSILRGWLLLGLGLEVAVVFLTGPVRGNAGAAALLGAAILPLAAVGVGQRIARRTASSAGSSAWEDGPTLWDPADPRLLTPKLIGWGWSFNLAHLAAWILLAVFVIPFLRLV